jgi:hypothetical protein
MSVETTGEDSYLIVQNVTGRAEERGFRPFWTSDGRSLTPALGYATSVPFATQRDAVAYGFRVWGEKATRIRLGNGDAGD